MKVLVTGVGLISAAGSGEAETLRCFGEGHRNAGPVSLFATQIKCPVFEVSDTPPAYFSDRLRTLNLCLAAVDGALGACDGATRSMLENKCVGVAIGTTVGSILNDVDFYREYRKKGTASMTAVDNYLNGNLASAVHAFLGTRGPSVTVANACTSGADAIGIAMAWIRGGLCDIAIAGGADEINEVPLCGFRSLGILSESLCRPFDRSRSGLNLGEGAAVLVLETERSAVERGARPRASVEGYGSANDGGHLTAPDREGRGLDLALRIALKEAGVRPEEIAFVNAHGTATEDNDLVEGMVFRRLFGDEVKFLSTKGYTGHTLGAAGSLEAAFTILALEQEWIPASIGFEQADPRVGLSPVKERTRIAGRFAVSTSVGFGGSDAALVCKRVEGDLFFS